LFDSEEHWQAVAEWVDEQTFGEQDVDVIKRFVEKIKLVSKGEWSYEGDAQAASDLRQELLEFFDDLSKKGFTACAPAGFDIFEEDVSSGGGLFYLLSWAPSTDKSMHLSTDKDANSNSAPWRNPENYEGSFNNHIREDGYPCPTYTVAELASYSILREDAVMISSATEEAKLDEFLSKSFQSANVCNITDSTGKATGGEALQPPSRAVLSKLAPSLFSYVFRAIGVPYIIIESSAAHKDLAKFVDKS